LNARQLTGLEPQRLSPGSPIARIKTAAAARWALEIELTRIRPGCKLAGEEESIRRTSPSSETWTTMDSEFLKGGAIPLV